MEMDFSYFVIWKVRFAYIPPPDPTSGCVGYTRLICFVLPMEFYIFFNRLLMDGLIGMGTEVHYKSSYYSMRNVNEDSNSNGWHLFYGDNSLTNGHYYDGFTPRTVTDAYLGHEKDELKQKMLQHEAVFKNQVSELHRLYRRQRDMMEEVKRREFHKYPISIDTSSSSSLMPSQKPYEDAHKWQIPSFPLGNSTSARPSIFGAEISNSPLSCSKGNGSKDFELSECRPSKVRKKLFDLQLPAQEYIEPEEGADNQARKSRATPLKKTAFCLKME
ncbi:hypothetical protein OSB04_021768 [Centaurea solstitialis]|uniref:Uncharacterized protein n=1 Tax=Centaurea solstitialis TaxID=347529 RepID=A0AA38SUT3_9ASTR|nr:hypothetical protein OSB04_021768 [Centaurea solstitialis]